MSVPWIGVALLCMALGVAVPNPRGRLRRLVRVGVDQPLSVRLLHGRAGALALRSRIILGLGAAAGVLAWQPTPAGFAGGVMVAAVVVGAGGWVVRRDRGVGALQAELADAVELLAVCLEAGRAMGEALVVVAGVSASSTAAVLARVTSQLGLGVTEQQAWGELAENAVWGPVARDVARSSRSGTSLVEVLHIHADEARLVAQEVALQRARTAGVRSVVPLMVCFLPAFVLVGVLPIIAGLVDGMLSQ